MATWTITLSECAENNVGMQKLGITGTEGFSYDQLIMLGHQLKATGCEIEFYQLGDMLTVEQKALLPAEELKNACFLLVRKGAQLFFKPTDYDAFIQETMSTKDVVDKKAVMRGKVVNKHARWNLCYADMAQAPTIEEGKGTVIPFTQVPYLNQIRTLLPTLLGDKAKGLFAELNYYYDVKTCGIGYHGDTERCRVIGVRIGDPLPLHYQWYHQSKAIGPNLKIEIQGGDFYVMGQKAVGTDWKKRKVPTLRHAAGYHAKYVAPKAC